VRILARLEGTGSALAFAGTWTASSTLTSS
jgi:hypothetical protein